MTNVATSLFTVCGLPELDYHSARGVTHVLSILDPDWPEPEAFWAYDPHHRTTLHFHDAITPGPDLVLPGPEDVEQVLSFGRELVRAAEREKAVHLLVHCHVGVSRSTAAMAALMAQQHPEDGEDRIFDRLVEIRPQAWPNSRMIAFADERLGRAGRLTAALGRLYARQLAARPETARFMRTHGRAREVEMAIRATPM